ncbi:MAG: chorismate mutase [Lentisphaeria bacterium]|nr:chorismate mutase [Lentisphaeria bacterium]
MNLDELRAEIDLIDRELLQLINRRAEVAKQIGSWKRERDLPIYVPEREEALLSKLFELNPGPLGNGAVEGVFRKLIESCRHLE